MAEFSPMLAPPTVAIVTRARAIYFKSLYETFAQSQLQTWQTLLIRPALAKNEHPNELVTSQMANLMVKDVASSSRQLRGSDAALEGRVTTYATYLPSRETLRILNHSNVQAVLIHEFSPFTLQALLFAKWKNIPVIVSTEIGKRNAHYFKQSTRWLHAFWGQLVDGISACCPAAHEPLSGRHIPTISTYHAVDSRIYEPTFQVRSSQSPVVFVYLGQLIRRKGLDLFLEAAAQLKRAGNTNFVLRFVGGGDEAWLRDLIQRHDLESYTEITGFLSGKAVRDTLQSADVFVLPTRQDTYAAVVHEAACLGLPLLISKHAGASEALVRNGQNGFVFDPENTPDFTSFMRTLMNGELRESMRQVSRRIGVENSSHLRGQALWQWMNQHWLNLGDQRFS